MLHSRAQATPGEAPTSPPRSKSGDARAKSATKSATRSAALEKAPPKKEPPTDKMPQTACRPPAAHGGPADAQIRSTTGCYPQGDAGEARGPPRRPRLRKGRASNQRAQRAAAGDEEGPQGAQPRAVRSAQQARLAAGPRIEQQALTQMTLRAQHQGQDTQCDVTLTMQCFSFRSLSRPGLARTQIHRGSPGRVGRLRQAECQRRRR